ncbi:MAG: ABC transporter ATP-binding protein [Candidatus Omnitrophica bacterium]|nr:ABC transporter ATP-binding protein [Candidatus Omnitrophota bacterium]
MSLLSIESLSVSYRSRDQLTTAVRGVSFDVEPGEILALVGESGSGKSSVALALTRLLPVPPAVISGRVMMEGANLLEASPAQLRAIRGGKIAYVFQEPATSLNPVLTIGEQLIEAMRLHTASRGITARALAVEWLQRVGMDSAAGRMSAYPHEFSGGMQQRVMLAMALAAAPVLLVADEPTTALDVTVQVHILRLLRDLQRRLNLAVLLITHDLLVVERLAHRVGVMKAGRLMALGSTSEVLRKAHG